MKDRVFTPDVISELKENEVFVFGSNKNGNHAAGAARFAVEKFGAVMGQAEGLQGKSYAFPTLDENMEKVSMDEIKSAVLKLYNTAKNNPGKTFYVTKVGCGIAGFSVAEMKDVFKWFLPPENVVIPREFCVTEGFKAFNTDMTCRGKKYEENETFEEEVTPKVCERGLHFCESPLDTLDYYPLLNDKAEYQPRAKVEAKGVTVSDDNKTSTNRLKIGCKLTLPKFIEMSVNFEHEKITKSVNDAPGCKKEIASGYNSKAASSGNYSTAASSGNYSKAASSGNYSTAASSGNYSTAASSGNYSTAASSGNYSKAASSGDNSKAASSGYNSKAASSGNYSTAASSGNYSTAASSGDNSKAASSGNYSTAASSGDNSKAASSGNYSTAASSGNYSTAASSGYNSTAASSGNYSTAASSGYNSKAASSGYNSKAASVGSFSLSEASGEECIAAAIGREGKARASKGGWIVLTEIDKEGHILDIKSTKVDGEKIKADTWYRLEKGKFIETE